MNIMKCLNIYMIKQTKNLRTSLKVLEVYDGMK